MFPKKATKFDKIFTVDLTKFQIDGEDFVHFCGRLGKYKLYITFENRYVNTKLQCFLFQAKALSRE